MKHSLHVFGQSGDVASAEPEWLRAGKGFVVVEDLGGGDAAVRFADWMVDAGAVRTDAADADTEQPIRIVILGGGGPDAGNAQADGEPMPDFVLGSARPVFAKRLVESLVGTPPP